MTPAESGELLGDAMGGPGWVRGQGAINSLRRKGGFQITMVFLHGLLRMRTSFSCLDQTLPDSLSSQYCLPRFPGDLVSPHEKQSRSLSSVGVHRVTAAFCLFQDTRFSLCYNIADSGMCLTSGALVMMKHGPAGTVVRGGRATRQSSVGQQ